MRIIVLGARGFVGSAVYGVLSAGAECVGVDVDNYEAYRGQRCEVLVNVNGNSKKYLAAQDPALEFDLSVRSVVRSIFDFPAERYVYISTVDVYTDFASAQLTVEDAEIDVARQSPYGFHKWLAEQYVRKHARGWLILRLGGMVGRGLRKGPIYDLLHDVPLRVHLDSRYQYIPTRTVGEVIRHLLMRGVEQEVYNVCGTGTVSLREVRDWLGKSGQENEELVREHYEINNSKLRAVYPVPETQASVKAFLEEVKGGGCLLYTSDAA
ncbi:MAG: NAD-dependent epimerase/dehydratase family protein, partial [bacterium]|nr:NAD-dependent epimerase/dehydratase family protein [bacterium]